MGKCGPAINIRLIFRLTSGALYAQYLIRELVITL